MLKCWWYINTQKYHNLINLTFFRPEWISNCFINVLLNVHQELTNKYLPFSLKLKFFRTFSLYSTSAIFTSALKEGLYRFELTLNVTPQHRNIFYKTKQPTLEFKVFKKVIKYKNYNLFKSPVILIFLNKNYTNI